jgi:hypothetical protein
MYYPKNLSGELKTITRNLVIIASILINIHGEYLLNMSIITSSADLLRTEENMKSVMQHLNFPKTKKEKL